MKLAIASAFIGYAAAFSSPAFTTKASSTSLKMTATDTPIYTFTKSEEIFAEAKTVSSTYLHTYIHTHIEKYTIYRNPQLRYIE